MMPDFSTEARGRDEEFPFTTPEGSDAHMFIQWKGTNVCLDLHCTCGQHCHFDGDFAYFLRCPGCDAIYQLGTQVILKRRVDLGPDDDRLKTMQAVIF